ncbi:hypothetical protein EXIGLDRAFT_738978 [Exidia glandulosa HHB12029]|uniref:Uncharacterized protein n=1 Tax=Exidia glandulosa HHB12029 TaxID=1314781 RepID=A0A166BAI8_EXIGL|nr:hypothetical protein EXIGLDRAFT_738978 [Exidia glandulosa HHB12029]
MHYRALLILAVLLPSFSLAAPLAKRQNPAYFNPYDNGGSLLNIATQDNPQLGEPLNVIISANSSPDVLTEKGFLNYVRSLGMSNECLNQHQGAPQLANLGDGAGNIPQEAEYRDDFGVSIFGLGTCLESLVGGNHLRVYRQSGADHPTGALFLAVSKEEDLSEHHTISEDGYNAGRDELADRASKGTKHDGVHYQTTITRIDGLMPSGSDGVNHGIAMDGKVLLFTVSIV